MKEFEAYKVPSGKILVVDDEDLILNVWQKALMRNHHRVFAFHNPLDALEFLQVDSVDVAILDYMMPEMTGMELLRRIKVNWPQVEVIMMTGYASIETALEAMKSGAYDYLQKPFEQIEMAVRVVEHALSRKKLLDANRELEKRLEVTDHFEGIIGISPRMIEIFRLIEQVAPYDATVMISGETGVGKERIARAIHMKSSRRDRPFVPVVCSAFPESLIESILFGHSKGAFTGATHDKIGMIQAAHGGTLFLDEVGDIPLSVQIKLLRVLQEGTLQRVGDVSVTHVDVRVLTATHRNLQEAIREGNFREDLYYRLNVIEIEIPPLRDRPDDIVLLAHHFLQIYNKRYGKHIEQISPDALMLMQSYAWPGNVRQLEHTMARSLILESGDILTTHSLPKEMRSTDKWSDRLPSATYAQMSFREAKKYVMDRFEKSYLDGLLKQTDGNISQAARIAGMDRANFRRLLRKNHIETAHEEDEDEE